MAFNAASLGLDEWLLSYAETCRSNSLSAHTGL